MKDLTKFICDLISIGSQLDKTSVPTRQIMSNLAGNVLAEDIPAIATLDYGQIEQHIDAVRTALKGADFDIDSVRCRLAQGKPVSVGEVFDHNQTALGVKDVVEFHGKYTVKLSNGREVTFGSFDITHY